MARMIYTSSSIALALLEILVHITQNQIPDDYVWVQAEIIPSLKVVSIDEIPPNPAEIGTAWLYAATSAVLSVPSVVVPEKNYLLNPVHTDFSAIHWSEPRSIQIDVRLTARLESNVLGVS